MKKHKKFSLVEIWHMILVVVLPMVCVTGSSPIPYNLRMPLIYAIGVFFIIVFVLSDIKLNLNAMTVTGFLLISCIAISLFYSYAPEATAQLLLVYLCSFTLLFCDMPERKIDIMLNICFVICFVIALSIIVSIIINNCMLRYFSFIVNPTHSASITESITRELNDGSYSGFARVRSDAAFIMNVGIAICFSKFFSGEKVKKLYIFSVILFLVAMVLTGRRMLFIVCIICFSVFMLVSNIKNRFFKTSVILSLAVSVIFVSAMFIPQVSRFLLRFLDSENLSTLSNRDMLWDSMISMFESHPIFGAGFNSYNQYAFNHGLLVGNHEWLYNGHNIYLQFLAELGIVGFVLLVLFMGISLFKSIRLLKKVQDNPAQLRIVNFSVYIQILIAVYSMTGNPLYTRQMIVMWFLSIGMVNSIYRKLHPTTKMNY